MGGAACLPSRGTLDRMTGPTTPRVRLLTKPGCHLCDEARAVVVRVTAALGVGWDEVDISGDDELYAQYWEQIPVTFVDGRQHDYWHVNEDRLRAALTR